MFDKPFVWYVILALIIVGVVLIGATIWLQFRYSATKFINNRFNRTRSALEASHADELKVVKEAADFAHNALERRLLLTRMQAESDEDRAEIDERISQSQINRDKIVADKKAAHAQAHRDLELSFGY